MTPPAHLGEGGVMSTATFIKKPGRLRRIQEGPLGAFVELFSERLLREGHCQQSAWRNIRVIDDLGRWLARKRILLHIVDERTVEQYMQFRKRHRHPFLSDRPALNRFLAVLRELDVVAPQPAPVVDENERIVQEFCSFLRERGGFAPRTIITHLPTLRRFLAAHCPKASRSFATLRAKDILSFISSQSPHQSTRSTQRICWTLRAFFRYLQYENLIGIDLVSAVPPMRTGAFSSIPKYLSPVQVQCVLDRVDRRSALGQRDYAVLLLLARLGLRADEVATLCLHDIDWKAGELIVHGKARQLARMPGHESMETTQVYLHAHLALKEAALAKIKPHRHRASHRYRPPDRLMHFLHAL